MFAYFRITYLELQTPLEIRYVLQGIYLKYIYFDFQLKVVIIHVLFVCSLYHVWKL